jgi:hypothetical protein
MITYEIRKKRTLSQTKKQGNHRIPLTVVTTKATPAEQQALFNKHYCRFWGNVGDLVVFKRPKRNKPKWRVIHIEQNCDDVTWTNGGTIPNYIKLETYVRDKSGEIKRLECKTCENKLMQTIQEPWHDKINSR